jgi:DNA invertase Pin-like site-specific DNA recombinase
VLVVTQTPPRQVLAYLRVSTTEQSDSGAGLAAQRATIDAEVARRGWEPPQTFTDTASGKSLAGREGLDQALALLDSGQAGVLVVAKLDRLSRSLLDFAALMERSRRKGWALVALDLGVDTTTPAGEMVASMMATFAQYERRIIGVRTKEALAAKKAAGVRLGRPRQVPEEVVINILEARAAGETYAAIADTLTDGGVPTAQGGVRWYPATVRHVALAGQREEWTNQPAKNIMNAPT